MRAWVVLVLIGCKGVGSPTTDTPGPTDPPTPDAPDPEFVTLNAAPCALDVEGALHCWGNEDLGFPAYDRGPYIDLSAFDAVKVTKVLRPDGTTFAYNCPGTGTINSCTQPDGLFLEIPFYIAGRALDGTIRHADPAGSGFHFDPEVEWRVFTEEGDPAALSADGVLRRMVWGSYPDDQTADEPPRTYQVPQHEDVVEVAAYGNFSVCVRYAAGDIRCYVEGDDVVHTFSNGPYSQLRGTHQGVCAVQAETSMIECSDDGPDRYLGPVRELALGYAPGRIPICVLTTDNAIRCNATYNHYAAIEDLLPKGTGVPTPP